MSIREIGQNDWHWTWFMGDQLKRVALFKDYDNEQVEPSPSTGGQDGVTGKLVVARDPISLID